MDAEHELSTDRPIEGPTIELHRRGKVDASRGLQTRYRGRRTRYHREARCHRDELGRDVVKLHVALIRDRHCDLACLAGIEEVVAVTAGEYWCNRAIYHDSSRNPVTLDD